MQRRVFTTQKVFAQAGAMQDNMRTHGIIGQTIRQHGMNELILSLVVNIPVILDSLSGHPNGQEQNHGPA